MTTGELVPNLWNPVLTHPHLGETVALTVTIAEDTIHPANLIVPHRPGHVTILLCPRRHHHARGNAKRHHLANQDVLIIHIMILWHKPVLTQLLVIGVLHLPSGLGIWLEEALLLTTALILLLLILVGAVEDTAKPATLEERAVNHDRILLIISSIGHNRHHNILTRGHLLGSVELAHEGRHQRNLRIAQQVRHGVKALSVVQGIHPHGLLTHGRLIGISGRLVVVWEGDIGRQRSQNR